MEKKLKLFEDFRKDIKNWTHEEAKEFLIKVGFFIKSKEFAEQKHAGQKRMDGTPYINHPKRVAEIVKRYKSSHKINELVQASLLHDTVEDTNTSLKCLEKEFGKLIASLVWELTSYRRLDISKGEQLLHKMLNMSSWALVIKLADRLDNVSDLTTANKKFAEKYCDETKFILDNLESKRQLTSPQKNLICSIRGKLDYYEQI